MRMVLGVLMVAGASASLPAQTLPPLEQVVEIRRAVIRPGTVKAQEVTDVSARLATQAELEGVALGDTDEDGRVNIRDACPLNPYCQDFADLADQDGDGYPQWQDVDDTDPALRRTGDAAIDDRPTTDDLSPALALATSSEEIFLWFLEENEAKEIYDQEAALAVAEQAGFEEATVEQWRDRFLGPAGCQGCREDVFTECAEGCEGLRGGRRTACLELCRVEGKKQCKAVCKEERRAVKEEIDALRREVRDVRRDARGPDRPPKEEVESRLKPLLDQLSGLMEGFVALVRWR